MNDRQISRLVFQLESAVSKLAEVVQEEAARIDGTDAPDREASLQKLVDAKFQLTLIERVIEELREGAARDAWRNQGPPSA